MKDKAYKADSNYVCTFTFPESVIVATCVPMTVMCTFTFSISYTTFVTILMKVCFFLSLRIHSYG